MCPSCKLVFVGNPPSPADIEKLYSFDSDYHVQFLSPNDELEQNDLSRVRKHFSILKKYSTSGHLLDIGCSVGFFLKIIQEAGWKGCGLEISAHTAKYAKERYGLTVVHGTIENTTAFAPSSFDIITMWDVIEHTSDPLHSMRRVNALLKEDGMIFLSTPNVDGLFPKLSYIASKLISYWPHAEPPHHLFCFSKRTLLRLLKCSGFTAVQIIDKMIPITHTFGSIRTLFQSPLHLLYALLFIPIVLLGVCLHSGDAMIVIAKKDSINKT